MAANQAVIDYAKKATEFQDRQDKAIDGVSGDITALKDLITQLQARPDGWTPEDQALLDQIQARVQATTDKLEALDGLTPPTPPTP